MKPIYKKVVYKKDNGEFEDAPYLIKRYLFGILIKTTEILTD